MALQLSRMRFRPTNMYYRGMQTFRNHIATIVAGIVVALLLIAAFLLFGAKDPSESNHLLVRIHDGNNDVQELALSKDATVEVATDLGRNVVVVESGTVRIVDADCPNGSCMQQQPISQPGQQLICLPHRLWVEIAPEDETTSSELDANAVTWNDTNDVDLVAQ